MSLGDNCSANCPTKDHPSWGACQRAKGIRIEGCRSATGGSDRTAQKRWDANLQSYRDARAQGIQPAGTKQHQIDAAVNVSNKVGKAFDAGTGTFSDKGV